MKPSSFNDKKQLKRRILRAAGILLLIAVVITLGFFGLRIWENSSDKWNSDANTTVPAPSVSRDTITYDGRDYVKKSNIETVLVMGLDKYEGDASAESYNNNLQSDFLMLFVIDHNNKTYSSLHINRDTMADIDILGIADEKVGSTYAQLALAHTYGDGKSGSCRNVLNAVSRLLGDALIEHYMSVTMDSVPLINDKLDGVEVTVLDDFTGIDDTLVKGEAVTLRGDHALTYVRTRYGMDDSTNSTRMVRQRQYLESLFSKAKAVTTQDQSVIIDILEAMDSKMVTDYDAIELSELATALTEYEYVEIYYLEGESSKGDRYIEFYPTEASIEKAVVDLYYHPVDNETN